MNHATISACSTDPRLPRRSEVQGERFMAAERLVVAPSGGVFQPAMDLRSGRHIEAGQIVGHLSSGGARTPVISPFAGQSGEALAWPGERVTSHQPVLWLSMNTSAP